MLNLTIGQTPEPSSEPENQSQPQPNQNPQSIADLPTPSPEDSQASLTDAPEHFDALLNSAGGGGDGGDDGSPPAPQTLSPEAFHKVFVTGFRVASGLTGFKSLNVNLDDAAAIEASAAIHETIMDIPMLHFLLQPGGKWFGRAMAIGAFAVPMAIGVQHEIMARQGGASGAETKGGIVDYDFGGEGK